MRESRPISPIASAESIYFSSSGRIVRRICLSTISISSNFDISMSGCIPKIFFTDAREIPSSFDHSFAKLAQMAHASTPFGG